MKVLGLISSPDDPASRARIIQYKPYMDENGVFLDCRYFKPLKEANPAPWTYRLKKVTGLNEWRISDLIKTTSRIPLLFGQKRFDIIWQNRLLQIKHSFWEKRMKRPVIFDFDDAIWINEGEQQVKDKIKRSAMIFAGNEYLAEFAAKYNSKVNVVPSVVDTATLYPMSIQPDKFILGWIGTKSNFRYLASIKQSLAVFLSKEKDAQLMIVSSEMPDFFSTDNKQIIFRKWTAATENILINQFSAGIMPLENTEWTKGKCSYKLLQYLACGKPVIASPVGTNERILQASVGLSASSHDQWLSALFRLKNDTGMSEEMGKSGRQLVCEKYSCSAWVKTILSYMKSIQ